jgi:hypothetical protein
MARLATIAFFVSGGPPDLVETSWLRFSKGNDPICVTTPFLRGVVAAPDLRLGMAMNDVVRLIPDDRIQGLLVVDSGFFKYLIDYRSQFTLHCLDHFVSCRLTGIAGCHESPFVGAGQTIVVQRPILMPVLLDQWKRTKKRLSARQAVLSWVLLADREWALLSL